MTKSKVTKRALLSSILSIVLCFTMLLGTTFAWFTDSVTSANNIIQSGTLDVEMYWADGTKAVPADDSADWKDASTGAIFNYANWEPGYAQVRHIKIANEGTLALKYKVNIVANGVVSDLSDVIDVYYVDPAEQFATADALTEDKKLGTLTEVLANLGTTGAGELLAGDDDTITLAFKMQEDAGNEYQNKAIGADFSVQVLATQLSAEEDSFGKDYDIDADYPVVDNATITDATIAQTLQVAIENSDLKGVSVTIPANSANENDVFTLNVSNGVVTEDTVNYTKTVSYDISLTKNDMAIDDATGVNYLVTIQVEPNMTVSKVLHNGVEIPSFQYDAPTGLLTFETDSFSPFSVVFSVIPSDAVASVVSADGKTSYHTDLQDAVASMSDGAILSLMADVTLDKTLVLDQDITATLNLAGHSVKGVLGTLVQISEGNITLKNGKLSNEHEKASETKYSLIVSGDVVTAITNVEIATSGTGVYVTGNAKVTELNAKVSSYHTANGSCTYDAVSVDGNARIDLISGGEYISFVSDSYIEEWKQTHSYSGVPSYALRLNSKNASVGEIRDGVFYSGDDRSNAGAVIQVNAGTVELISGGYFGFVKFGLQNPWKILFANTSNDGYIKMITGGKYEVYKNNYGCDFAGIVDASGSQVVDTGVDCEVKAQYSTSIQTNSVDVYEVVAK